MIDTKELGAGTYPEPDEPKCKCYQFEFDATVSGYGIVYAESKDEALERINNENYDDIIETYDMQIQEITNVEEND